MEKRLTAVSQHYDIKIFFLFFLVTLANYYIYVGFAIKPYMIFCGLFLVIHLGTFSFQRLQLFEVAMLLFYLVYSFSGAFALYPSSSLRIFCGIILYIFCFFIIRFMIQDVGHPKIERGVSDAGIVFNLASLILYFAGLKSFGFVFAGDRVFQYGVMLDRDYPRLIGLTQDPNFFVFYNTLFFVYFLCHAKSLKNKLGLILCILTNLLTFSRGGIFVMGLLLLLFIMIKNPIKQFKLVLGIAIPLLVMLYTAIAYFNLDIVKILQSRMGDLSQDGGSGRLELWGRAWDYFISHMVLGIGAFNFMDYNQFQYGDNMEVHNTFLEILADSGLLGITSFCLFLLIVFIQIFRSNIPKNNPYLLLAFLGMILQMAFLSIIINDMFFMFMAILSAYLHEEQQLVKNRRGLLPFPLPQQKKANAH